MSKNNLPPLDFYIGEWDEKGLSRRNFLETSFWGLTGIVTLSVGATGARFLTGNALESPAEQWVEIGKLSDLDPSLVNRVNYSLSAKDAWRDIQMSGALFAFSDDGGDTYTVLDATCTHLGCVVQWKEADNRFVCPCHAGFFSREGEVISGPPPKPLRGLQTKIENDTLWAKI